MVAIVTDVRFRMSLALIRDLAQMGVEVITCEGERCRDNPAAPALGGLSRCAARHVWLPEGGGGREALLALCREVGAERGCRPALLPVGAATLAALAEDRARFDQVCGLCIPSGEQLALFNDKARVALLAEELGIPAPESFVREAGESWRDFARRLPLPCVVKPVCGERLGLRAADRYAVASSPEEAEAACGRFESLAGEDPVVQRFLPGGGWGCSVLAREGHVMAAICHRRIREYPVTGGPSSCCVCIDRPALRAHVKRAVERTGYTGLAMFEFKEDADGVPRLLEVNPRIWGTFPLTRATGSGISYLWCALAWNAGNPDRQVPLPIALPPRRKKMIFAVSDLMASAGYARRGRPWMALWALRDFLNPGVRDGVFEWGDPRPGMAYLRSLLTKERRR